MSQRRSVGRDPSTTRCFRTRNACRPFHTFFTRGLHGALTAARHDPPVDATPEEAMVTSVTFVVRAARDPDGRLAGVIERVRTGEKCRFEDPDAIGRLIERMVDDDSHRVGGSA